jgi:hypothetical protein
MLAVGHMNCPDNAGVERLDDLTAAAGYDLALRRVLLSGTTDGNGKAV